MTLGSLPHPTVFMILRHHLLFILSLFLAHIVCSGSYLKFDDDISLLAHEMCAHEMFYCNVYFSVMICNIVSIDLDNSPDFLLKSVLKIHS